MDEVLGLLALDLTIDVEVAAYVHAVLAMAVAFAWVVARVALPSLVPVSPASPATLARRTRRDLRSSDLRALRGRAPPVRV